MKNFASYLFFIFFGLFASIALSFILFGEPKTSEGITQIAELIKGPEVNWQKNILGINNSNFRDSLNKNNSPELSAYRDFQNFTRPLYPLIVPTSGIAAHKNFLYLPPVHGGIDIWTNTRGKGINPNSSKGNAVYSACNGTVIRVYHPNEEIEIKCDKLDEIYKNLVPSLEIKILYAHMGDAVTHEPYHNLRVGQKLTKRELIGYQGNVSSITPINRVTHLHFGVYDLTRGAGLRFLDPGLYIGVPTNKVGQEFTAQDDKY